MNSPIWMPASYSPATRSTGSLEEVTSSVISGYVRVNCASFGKRTRQAADREVTSRMRPAGRSRNFLVSASDCSMRSRAGDRSRSNAEPAAVGDTERVVRARSCRPSRLSSPRMLWLSADCETPRRTAARVKLLSSATIAKAASSPSLSLIVHEFYSCLNEMKTILFHKRNRTNLSSGRVQMQKAPRTMAILIERIAPAHWSGDGKTQTWQQQS